MNTGITKEPIAALIAAGDDTLLFEFIRLETRMSDLIFGDPLNLSDEDYGEEEELNWLGTVWE